MRGVTELRDSVDVALKRGEALVVRAGCVSVMSGSLRIRGAGDACDFGEDAADEAGALTLTEVYLPEASAAQRGTLTLGAPTLGSMASLELGRGDVWVIRDSAFVAATPGVRIEHRFNVVGDERDSIFRDQVVPLTRISLRKSQARGVVYLGAFGTVKEHRVEAGDSLCVNGGLFLAARGKEMRYSVQPAGSLFASVAAAGGSWVLMRFQGPCAILTQSHGVEAFSAAIDAHDSSATGQSDSEEEDDDSDDEDDSDDDDDDDDDSEDEDDDGTDEDGDDSEEEDRGSGSEEEGSGSEGADEGDDSEDDG